MKIKINNKEYKVELAETEEEQKQGLQNVKYLPDNEGMLFIYDEPYDLGFWMKDTDIPLDIVFINEDFKVISVAKAQPNTENMHEEQNVQYVLEVNIDSGIQIGDELDFLEDEKSTNKMLVLDENGDVQMELEGEERIFSRPNTKILLKLASRAYTTKKESDYKKLGKKVFQFLKEQNERDVEHVELNKE